MSTDPEPLTRSEHFKLVVAVRDAIDPMRGDDQSMLLVHFGFDALDFNFSHGPSVGEVLMRGPQVDLIALARHLGVEVPERSETSTSIQTAASIDTYSELVAAETAFREIVRTVLGDSWVDQLTEDKVEALREKLDAEDKRRDGVLVSQDLLDYTEAYQLESLILKNWDRTGPVLQDKKRAEVYLKLMLSVRNTIAHSRAVVPFERQLPAGIAGQVQNLMSIHRSGSETADAYYASINYVRDSFGVEVRGGGKGINRDRKRLKIGQVVEFEFSASDPHNREIEWTFRIYDKARSSYDKGRSSWSDLGIALGTSATFAWTVGEAHVGEEIDVWISIANESQYQRNGDYDDRVSFGYSVSPPVPPRAR